MTKRFSDVAAEYSAVESRFRADLDDAGFDHSGRITTDEYDNSVEFKEVDDAARLSEAAQKVIYDAGFARTWLNHNDGWETYYWWPREAGFSASRGWRKRYVSDPSVTTDRVISGTPDPGYFEISYWPEGWGDQATGRNAERLEAGYYRIVPEPSPVSVSMPSEPA